MIEAFTGMLGNVVLASIPITNSVTAAAATILTVIKQQTTLSRTSSASGKTYRQEVALSKMLVVVSCVYILTMILLLIKESVI